MKDGGSVFPHQDPAGGGLGVLECHYGISLRDHIAIHATDKDVDHYNVRIDNGSGPYIGRARARYAFADAMLKARGEV